MVSVAVYTMLTGVAVGPNHDEKIEGIRHVVKTVIDMSLVDTACGLNIHLLPKTYQPSRLCVRCEGYFQEGWRTTIARPDSPNASFLADADERALTHALFAIRNATSKRNARRMATALGYDPPEAILEEHPDLEKQIKYFRKDMKKRYG